MAAAPRATSSWRLRQSPTGAPRSFDDHKLKKQAGQGAPAFTLAENPDILAAVAALAPPPYCVGFAAESDDLVAHASAKRLRKKVPLIVANIGPETFGARRQRADADRRARRARAGRAPASSRWRASWSPRSRRASRRFPHERNEGMTPVDVRILDARMQARLPAYATAAAPGSTCAPASTRRCARPRRDAARADRPGHPHRRPRLRGDDPAALGPGSQARHRARQPRRPDRLRLPGPADGERLEPRQRAVHDRALRAHRPAGHRAGRAGRVPRRRQFRREPSRRRRLRLDGPG